jgi:tetratricopeptide (TPR) repeat protein
VLGERHSDTAATYNNMALVFNSQGRHAEALEYHAKALAIKRDVLGERHPDTAATYNNMAVVFDDQGRHVEALEYYAKALAIRRDVLGERHPDTANTYNNMAVVFDDQGRHAEALEYNATALAIQRDMLGERHPSTGNTYYNMATGQARRGAGVQRKGACDQARCPERAALLAACSAGSRLPPTRMGLKASPAWMTIHAQLSRRAGLRRQHMALSSAKGGAAVTDHLGPE